MLDTSFASALAFVALAINPIGGLLLAIPLGIVKFGYPWWLTVVSGVPLAYIQVIVVDLAWGQLCRLAWFNRLLERARSPRVETLMATRGAFWPVAIATPMVGPWAVMAFMRFARVPQRHVALPIFFSLTVVAIVIAAISLIVPEWLAES